MFYVDSNQNEDGQYDITNDKGDIICTAMLCEDHQIRPSIAATLGIKEDDVDYEIGAR